MKKYVIQKRNGSGAVEDALPVVFVDNLTCSKSERLGDREPPSHSTSLQCFSGSSFDFLHQSTRKKVVTLFLPLLVTNIHGDP